jgi:Fe-S-cluster containining protein
MSDFSSDVPDCRRCGSCCGPYFALYVEADDEERWRREGRADLLERLEWERRRVRWDQTEPYDAETGKPFERCVFRKTAMDGRILCGIHATKPRICRDYPPGASQLCAIYRERKDAKG